MIEKFAYCFRAFTLQYGFSVHCSPSRDHGPTNAAAASAVVVIDRSGLVWLLVTRPQGLLNGSKLCASGKISILTLTCLNGPDPPSEGFRWPDLDQTLLAPKLSKLSAEMQKAFFKDEAEISFEGRKRGK
jgi:hypothetical protein